MWNDGLSQEQIDAVSHATGFARVLAGPGTGKTHCLTQRVIYLLEKANVSPDEIFAITFTRAAALELEDRLTKKFRDTDFSLPSVGTLHSFALKVLIKYSLQSEIKLPLRIPDDYEEDEVIFPEIAAKIGINKKDVLRAKKAYEDRWDNRNPDHGAWVKVAFRKQFVEALSIFRDFYGFTLRGGLVHELAELLDAEPLIAQELNIKYLLVDEYQDLNKCDQYVIHRLGELGAELFIVGDDNQSIYDFRSASPEGIRNFIEDHPGASDYSLDACHRCPKIILEKAQRLISWGAGRLRNLYAVNSTDQGYVYALQFTSHVAEAKGISDICGEYIDAGLQARDISILLSRKTLADEIQKALDSKGIAVTLISSVWPLDEREGRIIYCILRLSQDRSDALALRTWLALQSGIGTEAISNLREFCIAQRVDLWSGVSLISQNASLLPRFGRNIKACFEKLTSILEQLNPEDSLSDLLSTLFGALESDFWTNMESIRRFIDRVIQKKNIEDVKKLVDELKVYDIEAERQLEANAVRVMTMHKAKGLSSRVVIVPAMEDEFMPGQHDRDDRRRLMYVAVTRTSETLILTHARYRPGKQSHLGSGKGQMTRRRSKYVAEMQIRGQAGDGFIRDLRQRLSNMPIQKNATKTGFSQGFALVVGVSDYLPSAVKPLPQSVLYDARDLGTVLHDPSYCGYPDDQVRLLLDKDATTDAIVDGLKWLSQVTAENDTAIVYFSGHGGRTHNDGQSYLIPYDFGRVANKKAVISADELSELLKDIKAGRLLVLLDACHAGGVAALKAAGDSEAELKLGVSMQMYETLAKGKGRVILAASRDVETSKILPGMRNSLFTHFVLESLRGNGKSRNDGFIRVFDVVHFVSEEVPKKLNNQHPVYKADGENDFPIALEQGGQKSALTPVGEKIHPITKKQLREVMTSAFTIDELGILCDNVTHLLAEDGIQLLVSLDRVGGSRGVGIEIVALNIIEYLDRRKYLHYLTQAVKAERPNLVFDIS